MAVAVATSVPVAVAMALPLVARAIPTVAALEGLQFKHDVFGVLSCGLPCELPYGLPCELQLFRWLLEGLMWDMWPGLWREHDSDESDVGNVARTEARARF